MLGLMDLEAGDVSVIDEVARDQDQVVFKGGGSNKQIEGAMGNLMTVTSQFHADLTISLGDSTAYSKHRHFSQEEAKGGLGKLGITAPVDPFVDLTQRDDANGDTALQQGGKKITGWFLAGEVINNPVGVNEMSHSLTGGRSEPREEAKLSLRVSASTMSFQAPKAERKAL